MKFLSEKRGCANFDTAPFYFEIKDFFNPVFFRLSDLRQSVCRSIQCACVP